MLNKKRESRPGQLILALVFRLQELLDGQLDIRGADAESAGSQDGVTEIDLYLSMIDTFTNLSDCGMVSSGAGLGVARYLSDIMQYLSTRT